MSYLKEIITAKGLTMHDLADLTGVAYPTITIMFKNDSFEYSHKGNQQKIANALGFTVNEIINGGEEMKRKIAEAEIKRGVEHIINALNKYSADPMYLSLAIFTKDNTLKCDGDPDGIPDYYTLRAYASDTEYDESIDKDVFVPKETLINETARVYYGEDGIRTVIPFER